MTEVDYETIRANVAARFKDPLDLPKEIFSDSAIYRQELQRIFYGPYWHPVAHRAELPEPNSFKTTWLAEIPVLVTRADDGRVRAFLNTCTHRGTMLVSRVGNDFTVWFRDNEVCLLLRLLCCVPVMSRS